MSTNDRDETFVNNRKDISGLSKDPTSLPSLNLLREYYPSPSSHQESAVYSNSLEIPDGESEDEIDKATDEASKLDEVPENQCKTNHRQEKKDSWIRRNERHYFPKISIKYYRALLDQEKKTGVESKCSTSLGTSIEEDQINKDDERYEDTGSTFSTENDFVDWTDEEKDKFFDALGRQGKHRIEEISQAVGSKSPHEVLKYIKLLEEAIQDGSTEIMQNPWERLLPAIIIPAAIEINEGLERALDYIGEHVSVLDQQLDELEGKRVHGQNFWIIDNDTAEKIEEVLEAKNPTESPRSDSIIFQTASLLNIKQWIRLSDRVFMNAGESQSEDNWRNLAFKGESPSLTADAFGEFFRLTRDITKRLMEETFSVAHNRVAASKRKTAPVVRADDVVAAAELLHLRPSSFEFYIQLPRRLRLDVADIVNKKVEKECNEYLSYDEVEEILSQKADSKDSRGDLKSHVPDNTGYNGERNDMIDFEAFDEDAGNKIDEYNEQLHGNGEAQFIKDVSDDENSVLTRESDDETFVYESSHHEEIEAFETQQIEYERKLDDGVDYYDRQTSKQIKLDLRALFRPKSRLFDVYAGEDEGELPPSLPLASLSHTPILQNNTMDPEWRTELVYRTEWEKYKKNIRRPETDDAANGRKKRRME